MRDYGKVFSRIWESPDFRSLTEDGRSLVLYLLTCQHGTIAGAFRVPDGYACEDLQWSAERVSAGFSDLARKGFANRCETTKWVWVVKFLEWNPPENPNQRKAAAKVALSVPDSCAWKPDFLRSFGPSLGIEPPTETNPPPTVKEPFLNQEQEQYQEQKEHPSVTPDGVTGGADAPPPQREGESGLTKTDERKSTTWKAAKSFLHSKGMANTQTGTYLGALHRDYGARVGDDAFLTVLESMVKARPSEPEPWLKAAFQRAVGERASAPTAYQQAQRDRVAEFAPSLAQRGTARPPTTIIDEAPNVPAIASR